MEYDVQQVISAKKGDDLSFSKLYESIYKDLYKFSYYTLGSKEDAEDVVSETIIDAYKGIKKLREPEAFGGWIMKIISNKCKRKLKYYIMDKKNVNYDVLRLSDSESDFDTIHDVKNEFMKLSEEERMIIACAVFGGYKSDEIGCMLDINSATVRSKQKRALEKMKKGLVDQYE